MCGIAGIIGLSRPADADDVEKMNALLRHRGPDDSGAWVSTDRRVALGNRRLAILDLSAAGHQPMSDEAGSVWLTFNGEIYNYVELRRELEKKGHRFRTGTDTEVVLKAFLEWGPDCLERFNGMFAFAIWDERERRLFAARDRFGERPFYYAFSGGRFLFASEIKALLSDGSLSRDPDEDSLFRYLATAGVDGAEQTFFAAIRQLRPAHYLVLGRDGRLETERYWDLDPTKTVHHGDESRYGEEFLELFMDSVRLRLRSDVPVGSSLSGGLDSSAVVCAIERVADHTGAVSRNTFSARYPEGHTDEGRYIEQVVTATGSIPHFVWITGDEVTEGLDRFLWHQDEPVPHTSQYAQWKVMELAKQHDVTVLLDGQGADEILAGYPSPAFGYRYASLLRSGRIRTLADELTTFHSGHGSVLPAARYMLGALVPASWRTRVKMTYMRSSSFVHRPQGGALRAADVDGGAPAFPSPLKAVLYETLTKTSLPSLLRFGDRSSMAFSREPRLPFLDHRLVEYVFAVPDHMLVDKARTKVLLREATRGLIPEGVRSRMDKIGFATPETLWFRKELKGWLQSRLDQAKTRGLVDAEAVDREWRRVQAGAGSTGNVWRIANAEHWLRSQVERVGA